MSLNLRLRHAVDHVSFKSSQEAFLPRFEFDLFIHNLRASSFRTATYPLIPTDKYLKYIKYKLKRCTSKKVSKNKTKYTFPLRLPLPTRDKLIDKIYAQWRSKVSNTFYPQYYYDG